VSEYEAIRLKNIEDNKAFVSSVLFMIHFYCFVLSVDLKSSLTCK